MLQYFSIALFLWTKNRTYEKLLTLANGVRNGLDNMSSEFPSPSPSLTDFAAQISKVELLKNKWNNGKGSKANLADLRAEVKILRVMLKQLAEYAMNTKPNLPQLWIDSGFDVRAGGSPVGMLKAVRDFHAITSDDIQLYWLKLQWERPLDSERAKNIKYRVMRSATNDPATAEQIAIVSKSFYEYEPPTSDAMHYWIYPINSNGTDGIISDLCYASPRAV